MVEHYCAYLHHNYLPRALLMYRSLVASGGPVRLHLLCLSEDCAELITELDLPGVSAIRLGALEARYPELLSVKAVRWPMDYVFTLTPYLPSYALEQEPAIGRITYLDADLCFYADPAMMFEAMGRRSIAIVPHRFSPALASDVQYGRFNVGWISYTADAIGRQCLADYRADCLAWCHDVPEPGRFADQGYLDRWPARYGDALAVLDGKGVNTARWNVDAYRVTQGAAGGFACDDEILVFYHFQGIRQRGDGDYAVHYPITAVPGSVLRDRLYAPYLAALRAETAALAARFPSVDFGAALRALPPGVIAAASALRRAVLAGPARRIILYGAGEIGAAFLDGVAATGIEVAACVDADPRLHGTLLFGVPIMPLEAALALGCRTVAVASMRYRDEISARLAEALPGDALRIIAIEAGPA
jgi:hypothetical protein